VFFKSQVEQAVWMKHKCRWKQKGMYQNPMFLLPKDF